MLLRLTGALYSLELFQVSEAPVTTLLPEFPHDTCSSLASLVQQGHNTTRLRILRVGSLQAMIGLVVDPFMQLS